MHGLAGGTPSLHCFTTITVIIIASNGITRIITQTGWGVSLEGSKGAGPLSINGGHGPGRVV